MICNKNYIQLLLLLLLALPIKNYSHENVEILPIKPLRIDTNYIKSYRYELTTRFYGSQKYTTISFPTHYPNTKYIHYISNNTFNLGLGATYRGFTLNIGVGPPVINGNSSERGKTVKLDLQMHLHNRSSLIDVSGQFYKGFYNYQANEFLPQYSYNKDLDVKLIGISYNYIFNNKKFSLRPGFHHDERQLKSAGSLLIGFQALYGIAENKYQPILPIELSYNSLDLYKYRFFNAGPNIGYGYNWVFLKHFFIAAALSTSIQLSFIKENYDLDNNLNASSEGLLPQYHGRLGIGYQNDQWGIIASWVHLRQYSSSTEIGIKYNNTVGNARINLIYRFPVSKKLKKILKPMELIYK